MKGRGELAPHFAELTLSKGMRALPRRVSQRIIAVASEFALPILDLLK